MSYGRKRNEKKEKIIEVVYRNILFKCIYLWWRLYDRIFDEEEYHWIEEDEMLDLVAIAQSAPGAIAVNGAIVVGYKLAGISGVIVSVFGAVLPPFLIISVVSVFYEIFRDNRIVAAMLSGMQTGVGAVIISVVYEMAKGQSKKENRIELAIIMVVAFMASYVFDISVIYIILACIGVGIVQYGISRKKTGGRK